MGLPQILNVFANSNLNLYFKGDEFELLQIAFDIKDGNMNFYISPFDEDNSLTFIVNGWNKHPKYVFKPNGCSTEGIYSFKSEGGVVANIVSRRESWPEGVEQSYFYVEDFKKEQNRLRKST